MEAWKPISGFEGLYEVSDQGRIRSVDHFVKCNTGKRFIKGKILKNCDRGNGYAFVTLGKDGKQYNMNVHRAVAEAFIPNPNNLPEINHKDCNPMNPSVYNLEWCDRTYNNHYGNRIEKSAAKRRKPVLQILNGKTIKRWISLSDIGRNTDYTIGNISNCCNGKRKQAYGYEWRYE